MKIILLLFTSSSLITCDDIVFSKPKRIHKVESVYLDSKTFTILEIDSQEYLSSSDGGLIPLIKKNNTL